MNVNKRLMQEFLNAICRVHADMQKCLSSDVKGDQDTKCFPHPNSSWEEKNADKGFEEHMPKYQQ